MAAGECSMVKRASEDTKVLRSMTMLSRHVSRTAWAMPFRHSPVKCSSSFSSNSTLRAGRGSRCTGRQLLSNV